MIDEIKKIDKSEMFKEREKEKKSFFDKLKIIFGYGKEG
jgi:hypothetical protein